MRRRALGRIDRRVVLRIAIRWCAEVTEDVRSALRRIRQAPGLAAVVILSLALGLGANTALYSVVHDVLMDPEPYPDGNRIVVLMRLLSGCQVPFATDTTAFNSWRLRAHTIEALNGAEELRFSVAGTAGVDSLEGARVTPGFLDQLLRVKPVLGRLFIAADTNPGAQPVAMISHGVWRATYGTSPGVLGQTLRMDGRAYAIVGVFRDGLTLPASGNTPMQVLLPLDLDSVTRSFQAFARVRRTVGRSDASNELAAILRSDMSNSRDPHVGARAMRAQDFVGARQTRIVTILFAGSWLLLLIACGNTGNLLLLRGLDEQRELATRLALGALPSRLVRQSLTESVILAVGGGIIGIAAANAGLKLILATAPATLRVFSVVRIDTAALGWGIAASVVSGCAFGAIPALFAARVDPGNAMRLGGWSSTGRGTPGRYRGALVVFEVALSTILLAGAGILLHDFIDLVEAPVGFDAKGLVWPQVLPRVRGDRAAAAADEQAAVRILQTAPSVLSVQEGSFPLATTVQIGNFEVEGKTGAQATDVHIASLAFVEPGYFRFAGITVVLGRGFDQSDVGTEGQRAVVGRALARRLWPNGSPLGQRFRGGPTANWMTVIGVAEDIRLPGRTGDANNLQFYIQPTRAQLPVGFLVRSRDPATGERAIRRVVPDSTPLLRLAGIRFPEQLVRLSLAPQRFATALMGMFAWIALILTAIGLYAVTAHAVVRRRRELGIRIAVGATPRSIALIVLGDGLRLTAAGLGAGLVGTTLILPAFRGVIAGPEPFDFLPYAGDVAILLLMTSVACYVPIRRALRVNPGESLREE